MKASGGKKRKVGKHNFEALKRATQQISALRKQRFWADAIQVLMNLKAGDGGPDTVLYNAVISTCSEAGRHWALLLALVEDMDRQRVSKAITTYNVLLGALGTQRETVRALDLFRSLQARDQEPDVITYTQAINAHKAAAEWAPAISLMNEMCNYGTVPTVATYGSVLSANVAAEEVVAGVAEPRNPHELQSAYRSEEEVKDLVTRPAWLRSLACCGAMALQGVESNVVIFSTLLSSCGTRHSWSQSLLHADRMRRGTVNANARMCSALLTSCLSNSQWRWALWLWSATPQVKADVIMYNTAIAACQRASDSALALAYLVGMKDKSLRPTTSSYNAVLAACEASWEKCLSLLEEMKRCGPWPDAISYSCCLRACTHSDSDDAVEELLSEMRQHQLQLDVIACSAAIAQRAGSWEWALGMCASTMPSMKITPNAVTLSSTVSASEKAGSWQWALRLVGSAKEAFGTNPGLEACNAALSACERSLRWAFCLELLAAMQRDGPVPDEITYNAVLRSCAGPGGPAHIAVEVFQELQSKSFEPDVVALNAVANVYEDQRWWSDLIHSLDGIADLALFRRLRELEIASKDGSRQA